MVRQDGKSPALTPEARAVVWRILGAGAAPGTTRPTYEQIEPLVREHVPRADQERALSEMRGWFDSGNQARWLKPEFAALVADLILEGVGPRRSEEAIWAIGATEPELSADLIRRRWSSGEIDSFLEATIEVLNALSERSSSDLGTASGDGSETRGFGDAARDGLVAAYAHLEKQSLELVNQGLHPTAGNLIDLAVELRPTEFPLLVRELGAPAMQVRAARRMVGTLRSAKPGEIARWITNRSPDAVVALTIVHTLNAVSRIDDARLTPDGGGAGERPEDDGASLGAAPVDDVAGQLLDDLLDALGVLDPPGCVRWIGEVLSYAPRVFLAPGDQEKPLRLAQLEDACTSLAGRLFFEFWSPDLRREFQSGIRPGRPKIWIRHQAAIAWSMRDLAPERAAELARACLDEHRRCVREPRDGQYLPMDWNDWQDREWLDALGVAVALSCEDPDPLAWIAAEYQSLPLSVWDADESPDAFTAAELTARHWLLVVLSAIPRLSELGRPLRPWAVRTLAEAVWAHCRFYRQHLDAGLEGSAVSEMAARQATWFGEVDDQWILDQARSEGVGPRPLWVLLKERRAQGHGRDERGSDYDEIINGELLRIASDRFDSTGPFDLETLRCWGELWLLLGAVDQAERTALAIVSFPLRAADRDYRILALRLLGLVVRNRRPRYGIREHVALLYSQLWPVLGGTPSEEVETRRHIDEAFAGSELIAP